MKVGLDCRMITHPGIGTYIKGLLDEFSVRGGNNNNQNFLLFGNRNDLKDYNNFEIRQFNSPIYSIQEQIIGATVFKNIDLLHVPHFNIPLGYQGKLVTTIHDLIYLHSDGFLRKQYTKLMISRVIKKASLIIAVSSNTKKDLLKLFPDINSDGINVIYEAARKVFRKINDLEVLNKTKNKYNLPNKFILYVGSIKKHKNLPALIEAYSKIKHKISEKLVLVGRSRKKSCYWEGVTYLGEVPLEDLVNIYNLASLFVMPSSYEGFGLPILEAFNCGLPVVSSNAASLPEVVGDAGILVDPFNTSMMAENILRVLTNNEFKKELIDKGFRQSQKFSWESCAIKTLEVYKKALYV